MREGQSAQYGRGLDSFRTMRATAHFSRLFCFVSYIPERSPLCDWVSACLSNLERNDLNRDLTAKITPAVQGTSQGTPQGTGSSILEAKEMLPSKAGNDKYLSLAGIRLRRLSLPFRAVFAHGTGRSLQPQECLST
jgi:hypothetical protein